MAELLWQRCAALFRDAKTRAVKCYGTIPLFTLAICAFASVAHATSPSIASLGFDPTRFGLPIYPGATVRIGSAASTRDFSGHMAHSAVLETPDAVPIVASWYAGHWPGAMLKSYPDAPVVQIVKGWGTSDVSISISRDGAETDIRIVVPGSY